MEQKIRKILSDNSHYDDEDCTWLFTYKQLDKVTDELVKLCTIPCVSNLACEYKGKRIVSSQLFGAEVQVYDGKEWVYLFGAKNLISAKDAIDKLF